MQKSVPDVAVLFNQKEEAAKNEQNKVNHSIGAPG